ncbi:hypothetical protein FHT86_002681 [Rhizobium sp. BK313]|nr:hypothetical protein [Rhizobium sp. BK313]
MPMKADQTRAQTATSVALGAIFVSLELSKSTWLVTALSPGSEKMSRHTVTGGDMPACSHVFAALRQKTQRRKDRLYSLVVIQEAGLDGFWLGRVLSKETWIESHMVEASSIAMPRRHRRAKTDRIDGETLNRGLIAWKRGEPRACSMVNLLTPEEEDPIEHRGRGTNCDSERASAVGKIEHCQSHPGNLRQPVAQSRRRCLRQGDDTQPLPTRYWRSTRR